MGTSSAILFDAVKSLLGLAKCGPFSSRPTWHSSPVQSRIARRCTSGFARIGRAMYRDSLGIETFEMNFGANGVIYRNATFELRLPWKAIAEVVEISLLVVLLFRSSQGVSIPARAFTDAASRASFVAAMREQASGARRQP
jgi:YcxB-like protein